MWQYKFTTGKDERNSTRLAEKHHRSALLEKCLHSLRYYAVYRRKKRVQKQKLAEYAESQLAYRIYHVWLEKYEAKKRNLECAAQIAAFRDRFLAARFLEYWRNACTSRADLRAREGKMKKFYEKKLKRKAFELVKENWLSAEEERRRVRTAEQFARSWSKRRFFVLWLDKLEDRLDMKSIHLVFKARVHREQKVVKGAFNVWRQFCKEVALQKVRKKLITFKQWVLLRS